MGIAQDLGFPYSWIDTLCILQDDYNDWMRESSLVSSVYAVPSLKIAASGAANGKSWCFLRRSHTLKCLDEANRGDQRIHLRCAPLASVYNSNMRDLIL